MNYVAYYRVSTQKQNLGLDAQQTAVKNYLAGVGGVLVGEYSEKESGKNNRRSELMKAIADCKDKNAVLVIAKLDRLSRNVSFIFALRDAGVDFVCCDFPTFTTLTLGIFASLAQSEREITSERTKKALKVLKDRGIKLGRPNAIITDEMRAKSAVALSTIAKENENNRRAKAITDKMHNEGKSLRQIATWLNENKFYTSRGYKFTPIAVSRLLVKNWD